MQNEQKQEEKKAKSVRAIIDGKIDEYGLTKKTFYSALGIFGCLVLTIVMSITGMGFDPSVFATWNYWTGMIIQFGIAIFAMITGRQIGDDTQRNRPDSQFRKELGYYRAEYNKITDSKIFEFFEGWLEFYRERKLEKKVIETLRDFGIKQVQVLDLDIQDLPNLKNPYRKDWSGTPFYEKYYDKKKGKSETFFKSLTENQIEALRQIMQGAVKVSKVSSSYFMNALKGTSVDEWERAASSDKKKGAKLASGYSYRLFMMLVLSLTVNGIIAVPYESAGEVALNIAMRIFVLITSTIWGIYLGFKVVEMDIVFLAYKTYILKMYNDEMARGVYKTETIEEQAEREVEEFEEEQRKAAESVTEPEPVEEPEEEPDEKAPEEDSLPRIEEIPEKPRNQIVVRETDSGL